MSEGFPQQPTPEYNAEADPYREGLTENTLPEAPEAIETGEIVEINSAHNADAEQPAHIPAGDEDTPSAQELASTGLPTNEAMLPPEARGETNGGPLGCCLGVTVGLFLSLSVAVIGRLYGDSFATIFHSNLAIVVRVVMALVAVIAAIICGYIGWKIGKRVYKEYEMSPRQKRKLAELQQKQIARHRSASRAPARNTRASAPSKRS